MLARDAVLLHMAQLGAPAEAVLAVWACHALSDRHAQHLSVSLEWLADARWPAWLSAAMTLDGAGQPEAEAELRRVFRAWADCTLTLQVRGRRAWVGGGLGNTGQGASHRCCRPAVRG